MELDKVLTTHQLRVTTSRLNVLALFYKKEYALSYQELNDALPESFDRVTLYRILHQFEENGIIHKVINQDGTQVYAVCSNSCNHSHHVDEHFHFSCEQCEKTYCLENITLPDIRLPEGFTMNNYAVQIVGICNKCQSS